MKNLIPLFNILIICLFSCQGHIKQIKRGPDKILFEDRFDHNLDYWIVEQMEDGTVQNINGKMDISQGNGAVVWYKNKLEAPIKIEYEVTVVDKGGKHDRVADMNCFWMANDPANSADFFKHSKERGGRFSSYFSHTLYYVGQGGHDNTKTRFRKYLGNGERPLESQHDLENPEYLITANKKNKIKIVVAADRTQYFCNGRLIFDIQEDRLYTSGYFGIRSYKNHLRVDNFVVTK